MKFRSSNNTASGNTIAFNGRSGVSVFSIINGKDSNANVVLGNSIFSNERLGIDLVGGTENAAGATKNDPGDTDTGSNNLQNFPIITSAKTASGKTTINGKLNSTPNKTFNVQLFSNPSGTDEGKTFVGQKGVSTDGSGNATFTFSPAQAVGVGQTITATATLSAANNLNTSEFSAPKAVVSK